MGCEYYITESLNNPKKIKIGSGISQLFLKSSDGEEYLIEGNISKIKEYFVPTKTFEKHDDRGRLRMMIEYKVEGQEWSYKFYILSTRKLIYSRDIVWLNQTYDKFKIGKNKDR